jgi:hypothetical protein
MLLYEHRRSRDIDIFLRDPQYLTALSPRLNDHTEALTGRYVEQSNFLKLIFDGGEVDFIVAPSLTTDPYMIKTVLGTETKVETPVASDKGLLYPSRTGYRCWNPPPHPLPLGGGISYWTADTSSPPDGRGLRGGRSKIVTSRARTY